LLSIAKFGAFCNVTVARVAARALGLSESAVITGGDPGGDWDIKVVVGTDWK